MQGPRDSGHPVLLSRDFGRELSWKWSGRDVDWQQQPYPLCQDPSPLGGCIFCDDVVYVAALTLLTRMWFMKGFSAPSADLLSDGYLRFSLTRKIFSIAGCSAKFKDYKFEKITQSFWYKRGRQLTMAKIMARSGFFSFRILILSINPAVLMSTDKPCFWGNI